MGSYKFVYVGNLQYPEYELICADCGSKMCLVSGESLNRSLMYRCSAWPECGGIHSALPDGRPTGEPADKHTRYMRGALHKDMDPLWKNGHLSRSEVYERIARRFGLTKEECHIGKFDAEQCRAARRFVKALWDAVKCPNKSK